MALGSSLWTILEPLCYVSHATLVYGDLGFINFVDNTHPGTRIKWHRLGTNHFSKADLSNPYFTHHSDHPGLVLIYKSLNGENYLAWKRAMILALNSKNKLGFVNGSIKTPLEETDPEGYATWSWCNEVHSWIVNTLNPEIVNSVIYYSTTHEVWEDLHE